MPKQDGNIKIVESFITSNKPMSLNNKNIYYNEYSDEVLIRYYQTLIAVRKDKSVRILEGINKYSASTNVLVRLIERIAKEKGCTVTYVKQFAKGSTVKGGDKGLTDDEVITMIENNLDETYEDEEDYFNRAYDLGLKYDKSKKLWFGKVKYAKGSTVKGGKFNLEEFNDWWFDGGEETADEEYGELVTKALLKKQPSYPNEANAYSEALWELAKKHFLFLRQKANAHKKYAKGSTVKGGVSEYALIEKWLVSSGREYDDWNWNGSTLTLIKYEDDSREKITKEELIEEGVFSEKYAKGSTVKGGNAYVVNYFKEDISDVETIVVVANSEDEAKDKAYDLVGGFDDVADIEEMTIAQAKSMGLLSKDKYAKGSTVGEKEYLVKAIITDEDEMEIPISVNVFAKNKNSAMDKADDNIREQNPQWEDFPLDIESVDELKKYAKGSSIKGGGVKYAVVDENSDRIYVRSTDKDFIDKKHKELKEIYPNDKLSVVKFAKGSTLKNANSESEKFELKVLQALSGYNNGREENGIMEGLGLSNYRFNQYASKQEVAKVEKTLKSLIKNKYIEEGGIGYKITQIGANHLRSFNYGSYGNGGGVAVSSESGLAVGTNADLLMNQQNLQYAEGGGLWKMNDVSKAKYLGILEFQDNEGEYYNFEVMETEDRLVFGGFTNSGFIESGYIDKDGFSTDETLQELLADLEVYYNDGKEYTSMIVVNERMAKGGIMSSGFNYEIGGL